MKGPAVRRPLADEGQAHAFDRRRVCAETLVSKLAETLWRRAGAGWALDWVDGTDAEGAREVALRLDRRPHDPEGH